MQITQMNKKDSNTWMISVSNSQHTWKGQEQLQQKKTKNNDALCLMLHLAVQQGQTQVQTKTV